MFSLFGLSISKALLKGLAIPALIVGVFGGGWFSGIAWEHRGPQGFPLSILGKSLRVQLDEAKAELPKAERRGHVAGVRAQAAVDRPAFVRFAARIEQCEAAREGERDLASEAISRAEALLSDQAASAFRLGLASCEVPNATPSSLPDGRSPVGVVRDDPAGGQSFADYLASGAYRPADALPGERPR